MHGEGTIKFFYTDGILERNGRRLTWTQQVKGQSLDVLLLRVQKIRHDDTCCWRVVGFKANVMILPSNVKVKSKTERKQVLKKKRERQTQRNC